MKDLHIYDVHHVLKQRYTVERMIELTDTFVTHIVSMMRTFKIYPVIFKYIVPRIKKSFRCAVTVVHIFPTSPMKGTLTKWNKTTFAFSFTLTLSPLGI